MTEETRNRELIYSSQNATKIFSRKVVDSLKWGIDQNYWSKSGHRPKHDQEKFNRNNIGTLPNYTAS